jgi:hypothetical protein
MRLSWPQSILDEGQISLDERMQEIAARSTGVASDLGPQFVD